MNFLIVYIRIDRRNIFRTKEQLRSHLCSSASLVLFSDGDCAGGLYTTKTGKMQDKHNTQYFKVEKEQQIQVDDVLEIVYSALREKGYNPVNQIVGYIMSGDPTYITSHRNARSLIMKVERDELVEEILRRYIQSNSWG